MGKKGRYVRNWPMLEVFSRGFVLIELLLIVFVVAGVAWGLSRLMHTEYRIEQPVDLPDQIPTLEMDVSKDVSFSTKGERFVYALASHFSTLEDDLSLAELKVLFADGNEVIVLGLIPAELEVMLGVKVNPVVKFSIEEVIESLRPEQFAIVPFGSLVPKLKAIRIDHQSVLDKKLDLAQWPLVIEQAERSNRAPGRITTLVMTGVTAISRGVEYEINARRDPVFPARGVMDVLQQADITHVNSESPFFDGCDPATEGIILCGKTRSLAALEAVGVDVVDLTGNHQNDYGQDKNLESIRHLEEAGFAYFGGGRNEADARKILYREVGSTKLAFLGYNFFDSLNGPHYRSLAYQDRPGSNYYSEEKIAQDLTAARVQADFVVVDLQFIESYQTQPLAQQMNVFHQVIALGADLVVGVQAHQPQKIEFYQDGVIFYGLGNFFFDQMWSHPTRQGLIPRFTFYDGRLVSVEILTTLLHDYAQPRFTEGEERVNLLREVLPGL